MANAIRSRVNSSYLRVSWTKTTAAFFIFTFVVCLLQAGLQSFLFNLDSQSSAVVSRLVDESQVGQFAFLARSGGSFDLQLCKSVPGSAGACQSAFGAQIAKVSRRADQGNEIAKTSDSSSAAVTVASNSRLNNECSQVLVYPDQTLKNMKREDITLIAVEFWLLAISFIAVAQNSASHALAALVARTLATGWSAFAILRSMGLKSQFWNLVGNTGSPCQLDLFPTFFAHRFMFEVGTLALNGLTLLVSAYFTYTLAKTFRARVLGSAPPKSILRIHKISTAAQTSLLLSSFFVITAMSLWADVFINTALSTLSSHTIVLQALFIAGACVSGPWIAMGWFAARREMRGLMTAFLVMGAVLLIGWPIMFYSDLYRWAFLQLPLQAAMSFDAYIFMVASVVLCLVSRLNFNKGLAAHLTQSATSHPAEDDEDFCSKGIDEEMGGKDEKWTELDLSDAQETRITYLVPTLHSDSKA